MIRTCVNLFSLCLAALAAATLAAGQTASQAGDLKYVVIVTRHGVRSPTGTAAQLNEYSSEPWPKWNVNPGELTEHGRLLMQQFGAYYRAELVAQGLMAATGCGNPQDIYIHADTDQRTLETGTALATGIAPGCDLKTDSVAQDESDPIFNPLEFQIGKPDRALAFASVTGRIGQHPEDLVNAYRPAFQELDRILAGGRETAKSVSAQPVSVVTGKGDHLADVTGALRTASTLTENLLLEFTDGRRGKELGWGRLNAANLRQILELHTAYADLARRTPYLARVRGSNLLFHILRSLEQAATGGRVAGAMGDPANRILILVGHDTNLSNLSGMLGLNWLLPGYPPNDTPPGGALVFELRQRGRQPARVRTYYTAQSLQQMHDATPLTLESQPLQAGIFVPGCSVAGEGFECSWNAFRTAVDAAIDREFVKP